MPPARPGAALPVDWQVQVELGAPRVRSVACPAPFAWVSWSGTSAEKETRALT